MTEVAANGVMQTGHIRREKQQWGYHTTGFRFHKKITIAAITTFGSTIIFWRRFLEKHYKSKIR
jgi:hypothetical protein